MVFVKAHCFNCGADFDLYSDTVFSSGFASCPHCCATMPEKAYKKIGNAFMCLEEINKDLRNAHSDRGGQLFQIELCNHYVTEETFSRGLDPDADKERNF